MLHNKQGCYRSGKIGKCKGICVVREMSGKSIIFEKLKKVRENDLGSCRLQITVIFFCVSKY